LDFLTPKNAEIMLENLRLMLKTTILIRHFGFDAPFLTDMTKYVADENANLVQQTKCKNVRKFQI
jgi:hypothetical protein